MTVPDRRSPPLQAVLSVHILYDLRLRQGPPLSAGCHAHRHPPQEFAPPESSGVLWRGQNVQSSTAVHTVLHNPSHLNSSSPFQTAAITKHCNSYHFHSLDLSNSIQTDSTLNTVIPGWFRDPAKMNVISVSRIRHREPRHHCEERAL